MTRRWRVVAAALGLIAALVACGDQRYTVERSEWVVTESPSGKTLEIDVYAGQSSMLDYDRVEVDEDPDVVTIGGYVRRWPGAPRSDDFAVEPVKIRLDEPLGDRLLTGCAGDDITEKGWNLDPDTDCTETLDEMNRPHSG